MFLVLLFFASAFSHTAKKHCRNIAFFLPPAIDNFPYTRYNVTKLSQELFLMNRSASFAYAYFYFTMTA